MHLLRDFVEWDGRYPSPVELRTARPLEWTDGDVASAEALYDRLLSRTYSPIMRSADLPPVEVPWWGGRPLRFEFA